MKKILSIILTLIISLNLAACQSARAATNNKATENGDSDYETALFGSDILKIDITADEQEWESLIENAASKPTISADVSIDGEIYEDVAVKTKGNTSLKQVVSSDSDRYSLKLNFGKNVEGQTCHGLDKLALNNIYSDSTYLKEYMSYMLFQYMDVPSSLCSFAEITVNGEHYGFYLAIEDVDDSFLERNFGTDFSGEAYKPESMSMDGDMESPGKDGGDRKFEADGNTKEEDKSSKKSAMGGEHGGSMDGGAKGVSLVYSDDEFDSYSNIFDNEITKTTDEDKERLIASLKAISEGENLEEYINVDEVLRYAAVNVFIVNLDSYFSSMGHNYCLVEDSGQLSMIPWDYNLAFGTHQISSATDAVNYAIDTVFYNVDGEERPIISKLLENEEYNQLYHQYLQELCDYVSSGKFDEKVDSIYTSIQSYVENDTTSFDGYEAFVSGVTALKEFVQLRTQSVLGQLDGTIPATQDGQKESDSLVDCGNLDLKDLGSMGNERGDRGAGMGENPQGGNPPNGDMPQMQRSKEDISDTKG